MMYCIERIDDSGPANVYAGFMQHGTIGVAVPFKFAFRFYDKMSAEAFLGYLLTLPAETFKNYKVTEHEEV